MKTAFPNEWSFVVDTTIAPLESSGRHRVKLCDSNALSPILFLFSLKAAWEAAHLLVSPPHSHSFVVRQPAWLRADSRIGPVSRGPHQP
jgi:hypothetical protein